MELRNSENTSLLLDITDLIESSKSQLVSNINSSLTILFWQIGKKILFETLENKRAKYGKETISKLSTSLCLKFGKSYEEKNLRRMVQFAEKFPELEKVVTLSRHLSWSHFLVLIPIKEKQEREFYSNLSMNNNLGVRGLRTEISRKTFERTENANSQIISKNKLSKGIFKDPYLLEFLDLKKGFLENDLEEAILKQIENFILELGNGFTFVERQKRMIIDGDDYYLDLLFYHRKLKRLVAIELKIDKFKAKYKGQMELYLKWLNRYEKQEGENEPIGLILCAETSKEQIELLEMDRDGIMVAEYWTILPPKELLEAKLHEALIEAKEIIERRKLL
ncbi:DUF1016 family protein [Flammeovirga yaeyamensis]|uniref:DUF1016 family protein n=1 Tax=Flammeovirga yaeyamensis TaxID=367791 RepID=A0AAX1NEA9_9BACT|nr:PDDEXK nuclease domain-containing protein [Flammeovirga yaeyamensis]MBB3696562.1 putative nuclease of restriction endonuclease-like (RecB) superfamily [Flammeovirga yaeyamensis]NMF33240.1 DUF1016 domain-containing protein [Flammeovirga yaeyamensis]QWG05481.1 DUF1016 family protein [Flammeovirga yaeyamensis]